MIDPSTGQPYVPTPAYFLGCFDIYDREETLGEELEKFDPNNPVDREVLILNYSLTKRWKITYRQKFLLYKSLGDENEWTITVKLWDCYLLSRLTVDSRYPVT